MDFRRVPRAADIPYWGSPPVQFVYSSTETIVLGKYTFNDDPTAFAVARPILANGLYFFRNISLTADVSELDYTTNLETPLKFYFFLKSDSKTSLYREPIQMDKFYNQFDFPFFWRRHTKDDILYGAVRGVIDQGVNLVGKTSVTVKAIISAQEITNERYVADFVKDGYPQ